MKSILVLFGGCSPEYPVSLRSAQSVLKHLNGKKYRGIPVGISREGKWFLYTGPLERIGEDRWQDRAFCRPALLPPDRGERTLFSLGPEGWSRTNIDGAFPVLHGRNGEDGTVQGLLELADIPLVGCGTLASALCMDKDRAHRLASQAGVRVPRSFTQTALFDEKRLSAQAGELRYPLFVKPLRAGSSFGVSKVRREAELPAAVERALLYDGAVLLEEAVPGFEVGCAVLGTEDPVTGALDEIRLAGDFFDYKEKYAPAASEIYVPARIPPRRAAEVKAAALTVYRALGCAGFARVDFFLPGKGAPVFNEVNTVPGFTAHSRFPRMLEAAGLSLERALDLAIGEALRR